MLMPMISDYKDEKADMMDTKERKVVHKNEKVEGSKITWAATHHV